MNEIEVLLEKLQNHFNVGTLSELALKMDLKQSSISSWKSRGSVTPIKKKCRELGIYNDIFSDTTFTQTGNNSQQIQNQNNNGSGMINKLENDISSNSILDNDIISLIEGAATVANSLGKKEEFKKELTQYITTELIPKIPTM